MTIVLPSAVRIIRASPLMSRAAPVAKGWSSPCVTRAPLAPTADATASAITTTPMTATMRATPRRSGRSFAFALTSRSLPITCHDIPFRDISSHVISRGQGRCQGPRAGYHPPMTLLGVDQRRAGTAMLVFGVIGVVLAGLIALALVGTAIAARDLDERL